MQVASQQAQERALRLESELSAAQDRIGAAERKAAHAEKTSIPPFKSEWMIGMPSIPSLHAALNASLTPPAAAGTMQPIHTNQPATVHPAGSEDDSSIRTTGASTRTNRTVVLTGAIASSTLWTIRPTGTWPGADTSNNKSTICAYRHLSTYWNPPGDSHVPICASGTNICTADAISISWKQWRCCGQYCNGSDVTFRPVGAGRSSSGPNGGGTPPFPSCAGSHQQQRQGQAFTVQVKPKDPPVFRGRVEDDVTTWTAKVQDFFFLTDAGDVQQVAYAATLLQEAAADWWHALLRTRGGLRPRNFAEFADLLGRRFREQHLASTGRMLN